MTLPKSNRARLGLGAAAAAVLLGLGFGAGRLLDGHVGAAPAADQAASGERKVLYWYDPMVPSQRFDKPGKSPFMDMQLVPKYADEVAGGGGVQIDPAVAQNLAVRLATVETGSLPSGLTATGVVEFNERDVAVVQAKAGGFVQRVYGRAPADVVPAGAPLADLLVPEWAGAQGEFLAVVRTRDPALIRAARNRLRLLGMSPELIAAVERSGRVRNVVTVTTPSGGMIKTLAVRNGMTVMAGETLAEVNGLARVWLNAAVPEAQASQVRVGETVTANLAAYPGETFSGQVTAILPQTEAASRTLTARIELANRGGRLRPGMFATVEFGGQSRLALLVPSEAVIRTGRRALVMVAKDGGRYVPAEVQVGREAGGKTEILAGLAAGEKVVASGQFLLDSEASLAGLQARPITGADTQAKAAAAPALHRSHGRVEQISPTSVTLSHDPVPALQWPAMTMAFKLASPRLATGVKTGDRVSFAFAQTPAGPVVREMTKAGAQ
ncbi:MAG TPA: efflux RND transporter periplasmic adaptor subunit [Phenylobacterium sp.]|uniref:efflux RND transporter periplasmic adaptor subunit n=1 Tax=Phenylobacterium sp. TaxID=1871053 RepID=UPI002F926148